MVENKDTKIKLWAVQSIALSLGEEVLDIITEDIDLKLQVLTVETYNDILKGENIKNNAVEEAKILLQELVDELLNK